MIGRGSKCLLGTARIYDENTDSTCADGTKMCQ